MGPVVWSTFGAYDEELAVLARLEAIDGVWNRPDEQCACNVLSPVGSVEVVNFQNEIKIPGVVKATRKRWC